MENKHKFRFQITYKETEVLSMIGQWVKLRRPGQESWTPPSFEVEIIATGFDNGFDRNKVYEWYLKQLRGRYGAPNIEVEIKEI